MELYERIKERRKMLGLTADYVAEVLGVNRATVYRYESKDIGKIPISHLEPLAKVLQCTPAYLMGWKQDIVLTEDEKRIIIDFRKLPPDDKKQIRRLMKYALAFIEKEEH